MGIRPIVKEKLFQRQALRLRLDLPEGDCLAREKGLDIFDRKDAFLMGEHGSDQETDLIAEKVFSLEPNLEYIANFFHLKGVDRQDRILVFLFGRRELAEIVLADKKPSGFQEFFFLQRKDRTEGEAVQERVLLFPVLYLVEIGLLETAEAGGERLLPLLDGTDEDVVFQGPSEEVVEMRQGKRRLGDFIGKGEIQGIDFSVQAGGDDRLDLFAVDNGEGLFEITLDRPFLGLLLRAEESGAGEGATDQDRHCGKVIPMATKMSGFKTARVIMPPKKSRTTRAERVSLRDQR